ncbi:BTB/POZ protein [Rhizophagus clarus]|uniref:BTB/POZ protein n=1 Tax=Rhizophagus clarus TaxID=94130 RepID=A0A8H3L4Q3_9GLOM|nr:BTB/POZ protein [Rhizophagus clarus]
MMYCATTFIICTYQIEIFQIILRYIYGGILSLDELETSDIFKILVAADELFLQELVGYLQNYLIVNKSEWMEQHFELTHRTSFQSNNFSELQQYCLDIIADSPEKLLIQLISHQFLKNY